MIGVEGDIFLQLGFIIIIAAVAAFILRLLRQPQILAYVIVGILITPVFGLIEYSGMIESMSIIGIAFLLFIVGMEIEVKTLRNVALVSTLGGGITILVLFVFGYFVSLLLGLMNFEAAYIGLILAFSSTMVVMKLLSDKRELNTLHGRLVIGMLLVQDIVAIFALSILSSIDNFTLALFGIAMLKFLILFAVAYLCSKYLFPKVFRFAAMNQELLLITSLAVCFIFSMAFFYLGFSIAIGAFLAGVTLGNLEYNIEIIGKVKSLRDFFSLIFFVSLGMGLSLTALQSMWVELFVLLMVIVFVKPIIIMTICSLFKYTKKPSFLTANSLSQVGEFSLILAVQGLALGHIDNHLFSVIVVLVLVSITFTSYSIKYNQWFYRIMEKPLRVFDVFTTEGLEFLPSEVKPKIVLCGHNRIGYSILQSLGRVKKKVLVVDYNPEVISQMVKEGYHCIYGDITDEEIIHKMHLKHIKMIISTVPDVKDNILLIKRVRAVNKKAHILVTANSIDESLQLYEHGADYVVLPHFLGGEHVSGLISNLRSKKLDLKVEREEHIKHLHERKGLKHEHPKHD
jgi:Kef-type K+ transport system membrane component KefB